MAGRRGRHHARPTRPTRGCSKSSNRSPSNASAPRERAHKKGERRMTSLDERRDWNWDRDGQPAGLYVETRQVAVKHGPSAGREKLVFDFHVGLDDNPVSVWETTVLRSKLARELRDRRKPDLRAGRTIRDHPDRNEGKRERHLPRPH